MYEPRSEGGTCEGVPVSDTERNGFTDNQRQPQPFLQQNHYLPQRNQLEGTLLVSPFIPAGSMFNFPFYTSSTMMNQQPNPTVQTAPTQGVFSINDHPAPPPAFPPVVEKKPIAIGQPHGTLPGSLDPSAGIFYKTADHPRLRTARACEKCRIRKAKVCIIVGSSKIKLTGL